MIEYKKENPLPGLMVNGNLEFKSTDQQTGGSSGVLKNGAGNGNYRPQPLKTNCL